MNTPRRVVIGLLLTLICCLSVTLSVYVERQELARLEGSRLHTADAVTIVAPTSEAYELVRELGPDNRAFVDIEDNGRARAVATSQSSSIQWPTRNGRRLKASNGGAAIAGADVPVTQTATGPVVKVGNRTIRVVDTLGMDSTSLLADDILIADKDLFTRKSTAAVTFDGPDAPAVARERFDDQGRPVESGVAGRTNIDFISPVLVRLAWTSIALGSVLAGVIMTSLTHAWVRVIFIIGHPRSAILAQQTLALAVASIPAVFAAVALGVILSTPGGSAAPGAGLAGASLLVATASMTITTLLRRPWRP